MRRVRMFLIGFGFGFAIVAFTVAAVVFFGLGVGGHFLVTNDEGIAKIISYDPSTVAARAPLPAAIAVCLVIAFIVIYVRLRRDDSRIARSRSGKQTKAP